MFQVTKDFMGKPAPPNYVAGLGRGATGFTTRSDIGPAREAVPVDISNQDEGEGEDSEKYQDPDNETGLFSGIPYEQDDEEADRIYELIDKKMDERRKVRREEREKEELLKYRKERPKIQQQFADLKRGLAEVSAEEWASLPDVANISGKNRKKINAKERFAPVPDSILEKARENASFNTVLDPIEQKYGGFETPNNPDNSNGALTNFVEIGQARDKVLGLKLDQMSFDSASGKSTIDPRGYLTDLNSLNIKSDAEIGDIKKARLLLKSVTGTNPKHAPGWIAAARLEEVANKFLQARITIAKGIEQCPESEDIWLEAARLNTSEAAKSILADAVRHLPNSVKIWVLAAKLEEDRLAKKRVYQRALEHNPTSLTLWQSAIRLEENPEDAKMLLAEAVKLIPTSIELWLALAKLETYKKAQAVLQSARKAIPTSHEIWIAAAQLMEQNGELEKVEKVIKLGLRTLPKYGAILSREEWISEAEKCELQLKATPTAQAIIRATIDIDLDQEDQEETWLKDAEAITERGAIETARAVYAYALQEYPGSDNIWIQAAYFEKEHGTKESLDETLAAGTKSCPHSEILWLMHAKEKWLDGDLSGAQSILNKAYDVNPKSEQIYLAAAKLEIENHEFKRARTFFTKARENADTEKVWMKSIALERQCGNIEEAINQLEEANKKFPDFDKLWMIRGQIEEDNGNISKAREIYAQGLKHCVNSITLWILAGRLEEKAQLLIKARSILERGRKLNPKEPLLWLEAIRVEIRANNASMAKVLISKALQECPSSGLLWSEAIMMEPRPQRKSRVSDAIKACDNDPIIFTTMAKLFQTDRKIDKARTWFQRAVKLNPDYGDAWAWFYLFETKFGTKEHLEQLETKYLQADPKHGEIWQSISKKPSNYYVRGMDLLKLVASTLESQ
ncbi:hypothetical protein K502DRAFT_363769 [Neoconidiobolus thromboides FSU 785]|nr:hypothetical protein K502DRAFT_363769 [Neoconidiobolus thromboides FSU 785]